MSVKYKTTFNKIPKMIKSAKYIDGKKIDVGVLTGAHQWLAAIHEYGCNITVTPKMRAYLHAQGLHLSPKTTTIHIPERSFLRAGHDEKIKDVMSSADLAVPAVIHGDMSEEQFFDLIGEMLATGIKTYARDLSSPKNHPYTVDNKGSSNPLVDTGNMIEGITWKVK